MKESIKIAVIGLGQRGYCMVRNPLIPMREKGVHIVAVCDLLEDRVKAVADMIEQAGAPRPIEMTDYREVLALEELDAVYIAVSWEMHVEIAIDAMYKGIYVGLEAGGAYSLEDCYRLVRAYEETGTECMLMENCCYGRRELMTLNMVRQGLFGDVVHCKGAYGHDLRSEIIRGNELRHYRLRNYIHRNCENYPTHEIGPIAKVLNINNGNRFVSLVSVSSCAKGLHSYAVDQCGEEHPLSKVNYVQGDVVNTILTCAGGQTVCITLDTTLPRFYSRCFEVHGTKGMYMEDNDSIYLDGEEEHHKKEFDWRPYWGNAAEYTSDYDHPLWADGVADDSHGGIDHLVFDAFVYSVKHGVHPPIDVYDAVTFMAITALSEESIANGGKPVYFPDFTNGKWTMRTDLVDSPYCLDIVNNGRELYFVD